jgi:lysophospholipase L1-like esterase
MLNRGFPASALALAFALSACSNTSRDGTKTPTSGGNGSAGGSATAAGAGVGANGAASGGSSATSGGAGLNAGGAAPAGGDTGGSGAAGAGGKPWMFPASVTKPRIMIAGDSISAGPGCYKKHLLENLNDNGYSNFEFVGEYTDDCGGVVRHSAVSCSTAEQYTQPTFMMPNCAQDKTFPGMSTLMATHTPDLVMLQLGVNDVWSAKPVETILGHYATLVAQARAQNPKVALVVAQIHKIAPACTAEDPVTVLAKSLVDAVPVWAQGMSLAESPVFVADLWTKSDWSKTETTDCVHPNELGAQHMGQNWYDALKGVLKPD